MEIYSAFISQLWNLALKGNLLSGFRFKFFVAFSRHLSYSSDPQDGLYTQNLSSGFNFYPYLSKIIPTLQEHFLKIFHCKSTFMA